MTGHGGNIHLASRETGIPVSGIMDFSASINPLGVPESVAQAITDSIGSLVHYPEPFADQLAIRLAGASRHRVPTRSSAATEARS